MKEIKNGFTLIELLAVIIILAIVALIATPIILNVVDDAKKSAGLSESNMIYSGINNYCATEDVKAQLDKDYVRICTSSLDAEKVKEMVNLGNAKIIEIEYSTKLTWLKVESNGHIYSLEENAMVEGDLNKPESKYAVGDLLKVQVSDSETQNIYVLEVNGDEIVGILDRNLPGGTVAWISVEDYKTATGSDMQTDYENNPEQLNQNLYTYGAVTANKTLNERTSSWNKVTKKYLPEAEDILKLTEYYKELEASGETSNWESKYSTDFSNFILDNIEINDCIFRKECQEAIIAAGGEKYLFPEWVTINLATNGDNSAGVGYWTNKLVNVNVASNIGNVWNVLNSGIFFVTSLDDDSGLGIRPVIHISQSNVVSKLDSPEYVNPDEIGSIPH